jgi:hypothetical protein
MKLDRNKTPSGNGKYAVINLRKLPGNPQTPQELASAILANPASVSFGAAGTEDEFFVLKLKDRYVADALLSYADAADTEDSEYAAQVRELANRAGPNSPFCKRPD